VAQYLPILKIREYYRFKTKQDKAMLQIIEEIETNRMEASLDQWEEIVSEWLDEETAVQNLLDGKGEF
jgi:hypothetical protein